MKTKFVFNHENTDFNEAVGISNKMSIESREKIIFNCIDNAMQRDFLYGEEDDDSCPREMKTITGDLERVIKMVDDELELYAILLNFKNIEKMSIASYAKYKFLKDAHSEKDNVKRKVIELVKEIIQSKNEENDDEDENEPLIDRFNEKTMFKRIELIKKSHSNFRTYMNMLEKWANGEEVDDSKDIMNLINQALNKSDESTD